MKIKHVFASTIILSFAIVGAQYAQAQNVMFTDDADVIDHRQHIMKSMGEQAAIIGMILENRAPESDFSTHLRVLAIIAATAKSAFEPEVSGGHAKNEVWAQWSEFAERLDELAIATNELAEIAKESGVEAARPKVKEAFSCKGCHDKFREKEES